MEPYLRLLGVVFITHQGQFTFTCVTSVSFTSYEGIFALHLPPYVFTKLRHEKKCLSERARGRHYRDVLPPSRVTVLLRVSSLYEHPKPSSHATF
jgi:hypothetical protein